MDSDDLIIIKVKRLLSSPFRDLIVRIINRLDLSELNEKPIPDNNDIPTNAMQSINKLLDLMTEYSTQVINSEESTYILDRIDYMLSLKYDDFLENFYSGLERYNSKFLGEKVWQNLSRVLEEGWQIFQNHFDIDKDNITYKDLYKIMFSDSSYFSTNLYGEFIRIINDLDYHDKKYLIFKEERPSNHEIFLENKIISLYEFVEIVENIDFDRIYVDHSDKLKEIMKIFLKMLIGCYKFILEAKLSVDEMLNITLDKLDSHPILRDIIFVYIFKREVEKEMTIGKDNMPLEYLEMLVHSIDPKVKANNLMEFEINKSNLMAAFDIRSHINTLRSWKRLEINDYFIFHLINIFIDAGTIEALRNFYEPMWQYIMSSAIGKKNIEESYTFKERNKQKDKAKEIAKAKWEGGDMAYHNEMAEHIFDKFKNNIYKGNLVVTEKQIQEVLKDVAREFNRCRGDKGAKKDKDKK